MTEHVRESATSLKSCCAAAYENEWARQLLGDSYHPGGVELTRRLGSLLELGSGARVVDVAAGRGVSAIALADTFGCEVTGADLGHGNLAHARRAADDAGVGKRVQFVAGDAETLPLGDATFDAVLSECAFCTFPDKPSAAAEFRRVLRPGGRVGIADLTRDGDLEPELETLLGWVACMADARPAEEYGRLLQDAGFVEVAVERHDNALASMVRQARTKLMGLELLVRLGKTSLPLEEIREGKRIARLAADAVKERRLGYVLVIGRVSGV